LWQFKRNNDPVSSSFPVNLDKCAEEKSFIGCPIHLPTTIHACIDPSVRTGSILSLYSHQSINVVWTQTAPRPQPTYTLPPGWYDGIFLEIIPNRRTSQSLRRGILSHHGTLRLVEIKKTDTDYHSYIHAGIPLFRRTNEWSVLVLSSEVKQIATVVENGNNNRSDVESEESCLISIG
jgi:hypothetical protein